MAKRVSVSHVSANGVTSQVILLTCQGCDNPVNVMMPGRQEVIGGGRDGFSFCVICLLLGVAVELLQCPSPSGLFLSFAGSMPGCCFKMCVPLPHTSL